MEFLLMVLFIKIFFDYYISKLGIECEPFVKRINYKLKFYKRIIFNKNSSLIKKIGSKVETNLFLIYPFLYFRHAEYSFSKFGITINAILKPISF